MKTPSGARVLRRADGAGGRVEVRPRAPRAPRPYCPPGAASAAAPRLPARCISRRLFTMRCTRLCRTTSRSSKLTKLIPSTPLNTSSASSRPLRLPGRQIDLRDVAVHHHLRVEALAREHHLHLLGRAVLRFVENDEAVVERAPAHERDRRHFDQCCAPAASPPSRRPACRRARRTAAADRDPPSPAEFRAGNPAVSPASTAGRVRMMRLTRLGHQRRDRHRHREIRLARARRPDAENQVVALDGFQVAPLVDGLGRQQLSCRNVRCRPLDTSARKLTSGSSVHTRR